MDPEVWHFVVLEMHSDKRTCVCLEPRFYIRGNIPKVVVFFFFSYIWNLELKKGKKVDGYYLQAGEKKERE